MVKGGQRVGGGSARSWKREIEDLGLEGGLSLWFGVRTLVWGSSQGPLGLLGVLVICIPWVFWVLEIFWVLGFLNPPPGVFCVLWVLWVF